MKVKLIKDSDFEDWVIDLSPSTHNFKVVLEHWEGSYPVVKIRVNETALKELRGLIDREIGK